MSKAWRILLVVFLVGSPTPARDGRTVVYSRLSLEFQLPVLTGIEQELRTEGTHEVIGIWRGTVGESDVALRFHLIDESFDTPDSVVDRVLLDRRRRIAFGPLERRYLSGDVGRLAYGTLLKAELREHSTGPGVGTWFAFGALLETAGYVIEVDVQPSAGDAFEKELIKRLRKAEFGGAIATPDWTLEEARNLWRAEAPESCRAELLEELQTERTARRRVVRTDHFLIVTNAPEGSGYAQTLKNVYRKLDRLAQIEKVEGRRLLPLLVFRTSAEFYAWCGKHGISSDAAEAAPARVADGVCATWLQEGATPTQHREIFELVLSEWVGLVDSGRWLLEGVVESLLGAPESLAAYAVRVAEGGAGGIFDASRQDDWTDEEDRLQAALVVEFLSYGRAGKRAFPLLLRAAGDVPDGDVVLFEEVIETCYKTSLDELEERFIAYCGERAS